ncbi:DUF3604 domain-containing protein [Fusobacterium varium]|uniref:DUF3604 domain-containing protein n=1 Tax=Fusobacterium varium TaxID=856 RepID=UPI0021C33643|nr:DUF3604 domain-containing protein [Fusobacterium varium]
MDKYKILWSDMHSNLHHESINKLPLWFEQVKDIFDFWPFAYYPYYMRKDECGLGVEDIYSIDKVQADWEYIREFTEKVNKEGFPMFMGYEWQGAGKDGDHNVFFLKNNQNPYFPLRYSELEKNFREVDCIAIPHHLAYELGHRGKNWETHNDKFSPFAEIYSSHGSSENDESQFTMDRHIHMGPRTGVTAVEKGWEKGHQFGVIASGDNHSVPGVYGFGYIAVLAEDNTKESIWDAFINKRVYGVSKDRIKLDFSIDDTIMGGSVTPKKDSKLVLNVEASNAIDRIEIIEDNITTEMIPHTSTWEKKALDKNVQFKFKADFGWGPDRRIFPDIKSRNWSGSLSTEGKILSIEKCWSNFGQRLYDVTDNSCKFDLTSYKTTATGKWMGPSAVTTEGFIFEISAPIDSFITLTVDGKEYKFEVKELFESSRLIPLLEEAEDLLKENFNFTEYYRTDPWWHNAYKIKLSKAVPVSGYTRRIEKTIDTTNISNVRVRVWQKDGGAAWSSPIFVK